MLARALVRLERLGEARTLLSTAADPHPLAQADERLASGAFDEARELLDRIEPDLLDLRTRIELDIRRALVVDASGEAGRAGEILAAALESAEHSLLHAPFVESPRSMAILRTAAPRRVTALVDRVIDEQQAADTRDAFNRSLVEPLTDRELGILEYLPSRLTNTEIAGTLYISVNTLKTHLRNIYRKLDAADRDAAVVEASKLGLL
jgi:LuxR family maltose regulon positive regulatory protein